MFAHHVRKLEGGSEGHALLCDGFLFGGARHRRSRRLRPAGSALVNEIGGVSRLDRLGFAWRPRG